MGNYEEFVTMMTSKRFVKLCRCEKLTTGSSGWWGEVGTQKHKLSFCRKFCQILPIFNWAKPPYKPHCGRYLAFFCFLSSCDAISSSFKSPFRADGIHLGTFVPPKNTLDQILERNPQHQKYQNPAVCVSKSFQCFHCLFLISKFRR